MYGIWQTILPDLNLRKAKALSIKPRKTLHFEIILKFFIYINRTVVVTLFTCKMIQIKSNKSGNECCKVIGNIMHKNKNSATLLI